MEYLLQDIKEKYDLLEVPEPSEKQVLRFLTPKVESASEPKKEPDYISVSTASCDLTYRHSLTPKDKTVRPFESTSSDSVVIINASEDLERRVLENKMKRMLPPADYPPPRFQATRIPFMANSLASPFVVDDTQCKGVLHRYSRTYTLTKREDVVYGPAKDSYITELTNFIEKPDSIYPFGSKINAFFDLFLKPRGWMEDIHMDAALNFYRLRLKHDPGMFPTSRIAIMDVSWQMLWVHKYNEWKKTRVLPGGSYSYYHGIFPRYANTHRWFTGDVDTIYSCLNCHGNTHWVAMVISIPNRTVTLYDSGQRTRNDTILKEHAKPFADMLPHAIDVYTINEDERRSLNAKPFEIIAVRDRVPRSTSPHGDCGVYTLKFLECLMLGVDMNSQFLRDNNMTEVRNKLATEMYMATTTVGENMWDDPKVITDMMDGIIN